MKLSFETIKSITTGSVRTWQSEDGIIHFAKLTQKSVDVWYNNHSKTLGFNSEATTGVRLDFHTNSSYISFWAPNGNRFELLVDGVSKHMIYSGGSPIWGKISLDNEERKEIRVTLLMPSHDDAGTLAFVELDDGATVTQHKYDKKALFIGDSITQGWNCVIDSLSYAYRVSMALNLESVIQGTGGAVFDKDSLDPECDFDPDIVFFAYGCNDWNSGRNRETITKNTREFIEKIKTIYKGKRIVGISPIHRLTPWHSDTFTWEAARELIKEEIKAQGVFLVEGDTLVVRDEKYYADDLHPNAKGFELYAKNLIEAIKDII